MSQERKKLKKLSDTLFSKYIRKRDGRCQRCGTTENLQCAHIYSRGYNQIRFNFANAMALCFGCHKFFTHRPLEWADFVKEKLGEEKLLELKELGQQYGKFIDYETIITSIKEKDGSLYNL